MPISRRRKNLILMGYGLAALEESRVNILTSGDNFSNAAWGKTNVTISGGGTANQAIVENLDGTDFFQIEQVVNPLTTNHSQYRLTMDIAAGTGRTQIYIIAAGTGFSDTIKAYFNAVGSGSIGTISTNGNSTYTSSSIALSAGKYRCELIWHHGDTALMDFFIGISVGQSDSYLGVTGNSMLVSNVIISGA